MKIKGRKDRKNRAEYADFGCNPQDFEQVCEMMSTCLYREAGLRWLARYDESGGWHREGVKSESYRDTLGAISQCCRDRP